MYNLSISELNSVQLSKNITGQVLLNVENGHVVCNYLLPGRR